MDNGRLGVRASVAFLVFLASTLSDGLGLVVYLLLYPCLLVKVSQDKVLSSRRGRPKVHKLLETLQTF